MAINRGKMFEQKAAENLRQAFPEGLIMRLNDQMSGLKTVSCNPGDYLMYNDGRLYFLEMKSVHGASFPLINLRQYVEMVPYADIKGVFCVVLIWFVDQDRVVAVPFHTIKKMKHNGLKSLNPKTIDREKYYIIDVPSVKLRTFMNSDYHCLSNLLSGAEIEKYGG